MSTLSSRTLTDINDPTKEGTLLCLLSLCGFVFLQLKMLSYLVSLWLWLSRAAGKALRVTLCHWNL